MICDARAGRQSYPCIGASPATPESIPYHHHHSLKVLTGGATRGKASPSVTEAVMQATVDSIGLRRTRAGFLYRRCEADVRQT